MSTVREDFEALPDPDMVGTTAYRALHEAIESIIESAKYDGSPDDFVRQSIVGTLEEMADEIRHLVETFKVKT